jgi:hypothetical protein
VLILVVSTIQDARLGGVRRLFYEVGAPRLQLGSSAGFASGAHAGVGPAR